MHVEDVSSFPLRQSIKYMFVAVSVTEQLVLSVENK